MYVVVLQKRCLEVFEEYVKNLIIANLSFRHISAQVFQEGDCQLGWRWGIIGIVNIKLRNNLSCSTVVASCEVKSDGTGASRNGEGNRWGVRVR
jgi:hypothetical protein